LRRDLTVSEPDDDTDLAHELDDGRHRSGLRREPRGDQDYGSFNHHSIPVGPEHVDRARV
jgi:hypothetical protein